MPTDWTEFEAATEAPPQTSLPGVSWGDFEPIEETPEHKAKRAAAADELAQAKRTTALGNVALAGTEGVEGLVGGIARLPQLPLNIIRAAFPQGTQPLASPEMVKEGYNRVNELLHPGGVPPSNPTPAEKGAGEAGAQLLSGFTDPANIAALPAIAAQPEIAGRLFQMDMLSQTPQQIAALQRAKGPEQTTKAALELAAGLGMPAMIEAGLTKPTGPNIPDFTGRDLAGTPGAPQPRGEPAPAPETVSAAESLRRAQQMTDEATASMLRPRGNPEPMNPPRSANKPVVPEGPATPEGLEAAINTPAAPKEIATWEDAVARLQAAGTGGETREQIKGLFPGLELSNETAKRLARDAFGDEWKPGGQTPQGAPSAPVTEFAKTLESADFKGGNKLSTSAGMGAKSVQDLDTLAALRERYNAEQAALMKQLQEMAPGPEKDAAINRVLPIGQKAQLAREAIEVATNTGSWVEGEGMGESKTALGKRPLDWSASPEAAEWMRKNFQRAGIDPDYLPDELKAPKASAGDQLTKKPEPAALTPNAPAVPAPAAPAAEPVWMGMPLSHWKGVAGLPMGPSAMRSRLARSLGVADEPKAVADKLKSRIAEIEEAAKKPKAAAVPEEPERITSAAWTDANGQVHYGPHHPGILEAAGGKELADKFASPESRNTPAFGYQTDKRPFVPRDEAGPLAEKSGQKLEEFDVDPKTGKEQPHSTEIAAVPGGNKPLSDGRPIPTIEQAIANGLPMGARGAIAEYDANQQIIESGMLATGKKAKPAEIEALKERQKQVVENFKAASTPKEPAPPAASTAAPVGGEAPGDGAVPKTNLIDVPRSKGLRGERAQIVRMLEKLEEINERGQAVPREGISESQEARIKPLRERLSQIERAIQGEASGEPVEAPAKPEANEEAKPSPAPVAPKAKGEPQPRDLTEELPNPPQGAPLDVLRSFHDRILARQDAVKERMAAIDTERDEILGRLKKGVKDHNEENTLNKRERALVEDKATLNLANNRFDAQEHEVGGQVGIARMHEETAAYRGQPDPVATVKIPPKVLKAQKENLLAQVDAAIKAAPDEPTGKITISVPGDGEFTLDNSKETLKRFKGVASKDFPTGPPPSGVPSLPSSKGRAPAKVTEPKPEDLPKLIGETVSGDPTRFTIRYGYADGTQIVATDGRQLLRIATDKAPGKPTEPVRIDETGKVLDPTSKEGEEALAGKYPNWKVVTPTDLTLVMGGADTGQLFHILRQAEVFISTSTKDKRGTPSIEFFVNPDRSIGASMTVLGDSFEHNKQPNGKSIGGYNPEYLMNAVETARKLGNEKVDLLVSGEEGPIAIRGKNSQHIIMPMKVGDGPARRTDPKQISPLAGKALYRALPEGYGPLVHPDSLMQSYQPVEGAGKFRVDLSNGELSLNQERPQGYNDSKGQPVKSYGSFGTAIPLEAWQKADLAGKANLIKEQLAKLSKDNQPKNPAKVVDALVKGGREVEQERQGYLDEGAKRQKANLAKVHVQGPDNTPSPEASYFALPGAFPLGAVAPGAASLRADLEPLADLGQSIRMGWRQFAMHEFPKITEANRETGEAGARYASAPQVARAKGIQFAQQVTEGLGDKTFNTKFGTALSEDNLRDLKRLFEERAEEASDPQEFVDGLREGIAELSEAADDGDMAARQTIRQMRRDIERISEYTPEDADAFTEKANSVSTLVGAENSPFPTEEDYQAFLSSPEAREAIGRHKQLWRDVKDPLYREANDLDPDLDLYTRGLQTGARVNLKAVMEGEGTRTTVGPAAKGNLIRQAATVMRKDPFSRPASGSARSYEGSYEELMANGFGREYPVAKQHEFVRKLIEAGDATVTPNEFPDLELKGEPTKGYLMRLRPWEGQWLQVRKSLAPEFQAGSGLDPSMRIPVLSAFGDVMTKLSVTGFAEGSTHVSNLAVELFSGLGPTSNPLLNALIKSAGRPDILWRLPRTIIKGFTNQRDEMMKLAEIGAAKQKYGGAIGGLINAVDQGSRLVAADVYRGMAREGWVPDTETGLREFVNSGAGQYNKLMQPRLIRWLRDTTIQPFATAAHTFNVLGLRQMALAPGAKGTSPWAALALRADKAGGVVGFIVLLAALNKVLSGSSTGPKGTQLGNVGWIGDDKKLHQFPAARLFGYERGARLTGVLPYVEARRSGLSQNTAINRAMQAQGNAALSYATGPGVQFATKAITGSRPGVPMVQESKIVPPQDKFDLLKSQASQNVLTALQQASPAQDAIVSYAQGKPLSEIAQRQFSRYTPRAGMSPQTIEALPKIVESGEMQKYAEAIAKEARKLPLPKRAEFLRKTLADDGVTGSKREQAMSIIQRRGTLRYP